jgi:hypothetical protein
MIFFRCKTTFDGDISYGKLSRVKTHKTLEITTSTQIHKEFLFFCFYHRFRFSFAKKYEKTKKEYSGIKRVRRNLCYNISTSERSYEGKKFYYTLFFFHLYGAKATES